MNTATIQGLTEAFTKAGEDENVRVIIHQVFQPVLEAILAVNFPTNEVILFTVIFQNRIQLMSALATRWIFNPSLHGSTPLSRG